MKLKLDKFKLQTQGICLTLRIISYREVVEGEGQKEEQWILHHLWDVINAKQPPQKKSDFALIRNS